MLVKINFSRQEFLTLADKFRSIGNKEIEQTSVVFGDPTSGDFIEFEVLENGDPALLQEKQELQSANEAEEYARENGLSPSQYLLIVQASKVLHQSVRSLIDEYLTFRDTHADAD